MAELASGIADVVTLANGVKMPWLGLGTWQVKEGEQVEQSVRTALDVGYRHIDTAAIYGNERGVGKALRASGVPRDQVFVTTKVWNDDQRNGPAAVRKAFDASLERLGLNYVDLYLIHWPVKGRWRETWAVLEELYGAKRTRAIGVSNFLVHHLQDLMQAAKVKPMVNQVEFHPRLLQRELLEFCRKEQIVQEGWSPLMQGKVFDIPEIQEVAKKYERTIAQVVLKWNLQHQVVVIPRSTNRDRILENSALFDFELQPSDMQAIDALDRGERVGGNPDTFTF